MKYSQIKTLTANLKDLVSEPCYREVIEESKDSDDFEVNNVRFIAGAKIDEIQQQELESDLYILGCFNASFLSTILDVDADVIEAMQQAESFEAIGKWIVQTGKLEELQQDYASLDGYGHHFNSYDFGEVEMIINDRHFHVFDNQ